MVCKYIDEGQLKQFSFPAPEQVAHESEHLLHLPSFPKYPSAHFSTQVFVAVKYKLLAQVEQVEASLQVPQVEVQVLHYPSWRYLPSAHPGEHTPFFNKKASLQAVQELAAEQAVHPSGQAAQVPSLL